MKLSEKYYSGKEVQKILSISEPSLRHLVNQGRIRKVIPPGRKNGVYLKSEIDAYAEQWLAFLMAKDAPQTTFAIATEADMDSEYDLAKRAIGRTMDAETRKRWLRKNSESSYIVKHGDKVVAFFKLLPLKHETIKKFMDGEVRGWEITEDDVEVFEPGKTVECIVMGTAIDPEATERTRQHYVAALLRGVTREFKKLGQRGVIIPKIWATSETPTGIAMATHAGMKECGKRLGKRLGFVLDVNTSDSFLARRYKEGFAEWEKQQKGKQNLLKSRMPN